jgi:hypothetical protein
MKPLLLFVLVITFSLAAEGQLKSRKKQAPKKTTPSVVTTTSEDSSQTTKIPQKKNSRDESGGVTSDKASAAATQSKNQYFYEFSQPTFLVRKMVVEHDETGKGKITFEKSDVDGALTDPIQLSEASLQRINALFSTLNFLDSTEEYQSKERNYPQMGTKKIILKKDGKRRAVTFNWSENKDAKALADEYYRIANQFVWRFNITVARENQPLNAPGLMDELDGLLKRNEISDPPQLVPFLKELGDDERIPLIARNHAARLMKEIQKKASKS